MASSKNPIEVIDVPREIMDLADKNPGIVCNLRINQQPHLKSLSEEEKRSLMIKMGMFDTWNFSEEMESFLKTIPPNTRMVLLCQGFKGDIFTFVTDVTGIYWADKCYPRIDFQKTPRVVQKVFGFSNLWGGFLLAAGKVGRVKKQARLGYELLFNLAKRAGAIKSTL